MAEVKTNENVKENSEKSDVEVEAETSHNLSNNQTLIKKILIVAIALLTIFLILIIILLSTTKDSEEEIAQSEAISQIEEKNVETQIAQEEEQEFKFDFKKLDPEKLNEQLELLTNKTLEQEAIKELNSLENPEVNKRTDASDIFIDKNQLPDYNTNKEDISSLENTDNESTNEELLRKSTNNTDSIDKDNTKKDDKSAVITVNNGVILVLENLEDTEANSSKVAKNEIDKDITQNKEESQNKIEKSSIKLLNLINVAKIKGKLQKRYYDKINKIDNSLLLCRDNIGNIEIYFGPFTDLNIQNELLNKLIENGFKEAYSLEMEEEEFNKRCKY